MDETLNNQESYSEQVLPDGEVRICLRRDGIEACCTVSSAHLVAEKRRQLEDAINRTARLAFQQQEDAA